MARKSQKNIIKYIGFVLFIPSLILNFFIFQKYQVEKEKSLVLVIDVIDGDTFVLDDGQKARLLNVDAPEPGFCGSEGSKKALEDLIKDKKVRLERATTDSFGRNVAMAYLGDELINKTMIANGWVTYEGRKIPESEELKALTKNAKEQGLGIFSPECYQKENLENPKCLIKGNVSRDDGKKTYHFPGCSGYNRILIEKFLGDEWFCSEKEAEKAGFTKSKNCYGKKYNSTL